MLDSSKYLVGKSREKIDLYGASCIMPEILKEEINLISLLLLIGSIITNGSYLYYIGSSDTLPEPLTKEEEEGYLIRAEDGDSICS